MLIKVIKSRLFIFIFAMFLSIGGYSVFAQTLGVAPSLTPSEPLGTLYIGVNAGDTLTSAKWNALVNQAANVGGGALNNVINTTNDLQTCTLCRKYADKDQRALAVEACVGVGSPLNTDFVGDVNDDDDFDLKISCTDAVVQNSYQLCKRYADLNRRHEFAWTCVDFGTYLIHDFDGDVDGNDDFDLLIKHKNPLNATYLTNCGLGVRYSDHNDRALSEFRFAKIGKVLNTDFSGDVDSMDDFDVMLSCNINFEE